MIYRFSMNVWILIFVLNSSIQIDAYNFLPLNRCSRAKIHHKIVPHHHYNECYIRKNSPV